MTWTTLVSATELAGALETPDLVIVDVRHDLVLPERWGEDAYLAGHIPHAVFAHLDRDLSGAKTGSNGRHPLPSAEAAARTFGNLGIVAGTQVVAYDQGSGMYAARLWWMLRWLGHDAAAVLDGGFATWQERGLPIAAGRERARSAVFVPKARDAWVDVGRVASNLQTRELLVLDARAPERYRGEVEPIDKAAGHIPNAMNRPHAANLDPSGRFKAPAVLRAELSAILRDHRAQDVVHQCGSGVSACHNVLAFAHAGLDEGRLYPGSWSEWSADPARPIERG